MSELNMFYTGVGSREVTKPVYDYIVKLSGRLADNGFILRTGDATGSDQAFRIGAGSVLFSPMEVYSTKDSEHDLEAIEMASKIHPAWHRCSPKAKLLHARNCYQVLGLDLKTPTAFVACWTPYGAETARELAQNRNGGTATAIGLAYKHDIPIFNFKKPDAVQRLYSFLRSNYNLGG